MGRALMPGRKLRSITPKRRNVYEALGKGGMSKASAARIANAGKTKKGRSRMARKAAKEQIARNGREVT